VLHGHRAEFVTLEQLAPFAHSLLYKERGTTGHFDFDQYGDNNQHRPEEKQTQ
jgi:hypothetical protein